MYSVICISHYCINFLLFVQPVPEKSKIWECLGSQTFFWDRVRRTQRRPDERGHGSVQAQANGTKPLPHHLRFLGAAEGAEVEQRQALGGCGRQRVRKQSLSRSCSTRWTSRWREHCLHCLFVLLTNCWRAPLTNFGWPPRTKGNLRKIGTGWRRSIGCLNSVFQKLRIS